MEKLKKKKRYYFPYKLFNLDHKSKSQTNIFQRNISPLHSIYLNSKKNMEVNSFVKKLKSTILSNKIFSKYMDNYIGQTQDFCFKSPENTVYPLKKNFQFLPINERINHIIEEEPKVDDIKINNENEENSVIEKPYGFKYKKTKIVINRDRDFYNHNNSSERKKSKLFMSFSEGDYTHELLKTFGLNNIDINNNNEIIKKNFEYLHESIINLNSLENFTSEKSIEFKIKNHFTKEDIQFNMNIYSLCFNFYEIKKDNNDNNNTNDNNKIIKKQKLYLPFKLLPFFYLLNYSKFKNFISEIIYYDKDTKLMNFNHDKFREKIKKYSFHLRSIYQRNNSDDFKDITFYKNEYVYHNYYDWAVINEKDGKNNDNIIYKMKIIFPKVIFEEKNNKIKVINHLNKNILIQVLKQCFVDWEKLVLFDLFSNKRFRLLINKILVGRNKYFEKKIKLHENKTYIIINTIYNNSIDNKSFKNNFSKPNKNYEFFITDAVKKESFYYIFIPNIILLLVGEVKKSFQKIYLNLKESRKLFELSKYWGELNTLFKCMYKDEISNKIHFKLNLLEDMPQELYKTIQNEKISFRDSLRLRTINANSSNFSKEKSNCLRYKTNDLELLLLECLLNKININFNETKYFYYQVPIKLLNTILTTKDNMKIVHCIIDCYHDIIKNENEVDIIDEERIMIKKIYENQKGNSSNEKNRYEKHLLINQNKFNPSKTFNKTKTFYIRNNNSNIKNLYPKSFNKLNSFAQNQRNTFGNKISKKGTVVFNKKKTMNINNFNDSNEKIKINENNRFPKIDKINDNLFKYKDNSEFERMRLSRNYSKNH